MDLIINSIIAQQKGGNMRAKGKAKLILAAAVVVVGIIGVIAAGSSNAAEADLRTPDTWSQHATPGGFADMAKGIKLGGDGTMNIGLTSRYRLRTNDYANDQDFYQYIRANVEGIKVGSGTVYGNIFFRAADDLDGADNNQWGSTYYYFHKDVLDAELKHNDLAPRLYQGNLTFDKVIPMTKLTAGRLYASHINTYQLDGGDISIGSDKVKVYAFGGAPVSYFYDWNEDYIYGGGIEATPISGTKIAAEYVRLDVEGLKDNLFNIRLDRDITKGMHFYGIYTSLNSKSAFEGGILYRMEKTKTFVKVKYKGLYDEIGTDNSYVVNPITVALLPYGKYNSYNVEIGQGIGSNAIVAAGTEIKAAGGTPNFDNRDYKKYYGSIDLIGVPHKDTYISISGEKWDIDKVGSATGLGAPSLGDSDKLQISARANQKITKAVDAWAGTNFDRYKYNEQTNEREEKVRIYYIGGQWAPSKTISLLIDLGMENSDMFNGGSDLKDNYTLQAWLNIIF